MLAFWLARLLACSHACLVSGGVGIESGEKESQEKAPLERARNNGAGEAMREARDQTVPGAAGARGSDDFSATGLVHRSPSMFSGILLTNLCQDPVRQDSPSARATHVMV